MNTVRSLDACGSGPTLAPGTNVGSYGVVRCIGVGGIGAVYEARHRRLDKPVAVKTLHERIAADGNARERFLREGKLAARLRHPHIVDVSDFAVEGEMPYLVMELLQGENLGSLIEREGPLSVVQTVDLLLPIVSALRFAHESGIVHRDLKPQNVFLSKTPTGGLVPKVVDFGISKWVDEPSCHLTRSQAILGTPHYMSPEQAAGAALVDHRSDQFSLGVIAYECLSGARPFEGGSMLAVLNSVIHHEPPPLETSARGIPPRLARLIATMMAKAPAERCTDMHQVGAALLPFASSRVRLSFEDAFRVDADLAIGDASTNPSSTVFTNTVWSVKRAGQSARRLWSRWQLWGVTAAFAGVALGLGGGALVNLKLRPTFRHASELTKLDTPIPGRSVRLTSDDSMCSATAVTVGLAPDGSGFGRSPFPSGVPPQTNAAFMLPNRIELSASRADGLNNGRSVHAARNGNVQSPHVVRQIAPTPTVIRQPIEPVRGNNGAPIIP